MLLSIVFVIVGRMILLFYHRMGRFLLLAFGGSYCRSRRQVTCLLLICFCIVLLLVLFIFVSIIFSLETSTETVSPKSFLTRFSFISGVIIICRCCCLILTF